MKILRPLARGLPPAPLPTPHQLGGSQPVTHFLQPWSCRDQRATGRGGQWRLGLEHRLPSALPLPPNVARAPWACIPTKPTQPLTYQALRNIPDSGTDLPSGGARSLGLGSDQRLGDGTRRVGRQVGPLSPQLWSPEVWPRPCKSRKNSAGENSAQNHAALTKQILLLLKKQKPAACSGHPSSPAAPALPTAV